MTLAHIDITVGNDTNRKNTVQQVDKEVETYAERTNINGTGLGINSTLNNNARNIPQTKDTVNGDEIVDQSY